MLLILLSFLSTHTFPPIYAFDCACAIEYSEFVKQSELCLQRRLKPTSCPSFQLFFEMTRDSDWGIGERGGLPLQQRRTDSIKRREETDDSRMKQKVFQVGFIVLIFSSHMLPFSVKAYITALSTMEESIYKRVKGIVSQQFLH